MQDSLEDYIKVANNVHTNPTKGDSEKENVLFSDTKALKIVEFAIDGQLRPEVFIKCLNYITPSFYQDIVEERHLAQYCGYPICGHRIHNKPKKQYFISTKANKVYDITERINFCSNFCYKASNHIMEQIDSSPLWLRTDQNCRKFQLLLANEKGIPGEEVLSTSIDTDETLFTSVSEFAEASLDEAQESELTTEFKRLIIDKSRECNKHKLIASPRINIADKYECDAKSNEKARDITIQNDRRSILVNEVKSEVVENCKSLDKRLKKALEKVKRMEEEGIKNKTLLIETIKNPEIQQRDYAGKYEKNCSKCELHAKNHGTKIEKSEQTDINAAYIGNIFQAFKAWTTLDSLFFLHGEKRIRLALTEYKLLDIFDRLRVHELSIAQQVRYRDICRRMHMQDMIEKRKDGDLIDGTSGRRGRERKPLPEYMDLKKESRELTVKVKAFYNGLPYTPSSIPIKTEQIAVVENSDGSIRVDNAQITEEEIPAVLPLVDNSSRSAIRRKIFLKSADIQIRKHLLALNLEQNLIEEIQNLVYTFQLSSKNIVFKPNEWKLIGIALLEILSIRNEDLQNSLNSELYNNYIQYEFPSILNFKNFTSSLKDYLQNVELFIELYISSDN